MKMNTIKGKILKINEKEIFIPEEKLSGLFDVVLIMREEDKLIPSVCLVEETCEEDYDYDYEESLVFMGTTSYKKYYPIKFNPFTGEKYKFSVGKIIDITEQYEDILNRLEEVRSIRKSKKKDKILSEIFSELENIFDGVPPIYENLSVLHEDNACSIYQYLNDFNTYGYNIFL